MYIHKDDDDDALSTCCFCCFPRTTIQWTLLTICGTCQPLVQTMKVKGMATCTVNQGTLLSRHLTIGTSCVKRRLANTTNIVVSNIPGPIRDHGSWLDLDFHIERVCCVRKRYTTRARVDFISFATPPPTSAHPNHRYPYVAIAPIFTMIPLWPIRSIQLLLGSDIWNQG